MAIFDKAELVEINELITCGQYKEAQRSLDSIKKSDVKLTTNEKLLCRFLSSKILLYQGNYKKCYKTAEKVYNRFLKKNDLAFSLETVNLIITAFNNLDDINEMKLWINNSEELYEKLFKEEKEENISAIAHFLMVKGIHFFKIGDFEDARIALHQALALVDKNKNEPLKAKILGNIAALSFKQGNIDLAIENYQQSLDIWEAIANPFAVAKTKNELASILTLQGDIHLALAIFQQELEIVMRNTDKILIAAYQKNIGLIYLEMNRFQQAQEWLELSLKNYKTANNLRKTSEVLYYLILSHIKNDNFKKANKNFEQLIKLENEIEDILVNQWFLLAKALILGENKRYINLGKIEEIYSEIMNKKELDIKITSMALFNLSELLVNYLLKTKDQDLLNELERNLLKLIAYADIQDSYILYIETYLLQAQTAILKINLQ
jgi:tetratricopeptide (TPR) repeat protein